VSLALPAATLALVDVRISCDRAAVKPDRGALRKLSIGGDPHKTAAGIQQVLISTMAPELRWWRSIDPRLGIFPNLVDLF